MMRRCAALWCVALLAGCGGVATIPETTYYRLPEPLGVKPLEAALSADPISVDAFIADGLQNQQAMLYSIDGDGTRLRSYHYQLWAEPPGRLLQRRLIATLREAGAAPVVVDRWPPSSPQLRVRGLLTRFERLNGGSTPVASFGVQFRVESSARVQPWLLRDYRVDETAEGPAIEHYVAAMARAVDRVFEAFMMDLEAALE